jgi:hypothetical protein
MTTQPVPSSSDPRHLLAATRDLARRVRREQRGAWFPVLVFAAVTFAATPFDRYGHRGPTHCASLNGGSVCTVYSPLTMWYWSVALLLAYVAISWFYIHRSGKLGVGTRVQPYVVVGVVLALLTIAYGLWTATHPASLTDLRGPSSPFAPFANAVMSPAGAIGLALLLLAWIERSWVLLAVTCGYLIVLLLTTNIRVQFGTHPSPWVFLPHLLVHGGVLLLGGVVLALVQRAQERSAA